jgi:hypothetical protein
MKTKLIHAITFSVLIISCSTPEQEKVDTIPLQGTWELFSETKIEGNDTTFSVIPADQRMIKMLNQSHFAFLRHDLNKGKDSTRAIFVAGGGTYTLVGDKYSEHLEYFNIREWENNDFEFTVDIKNDTLTQQGREKVEGLADRIIIEKYRRVVN